MSEITDENLPPELQTKPFNALDVEDDDEWDAVVDGAPDKPRIPPGRYLMRYHDHYLDKSRRKARVDCVIVSGEYAGLVLSRWFNLAPSGTGRLKVQTLSDYSRTFRRMTGQKFPRPDRPPSPKYLKNVGVFWGEVVDVTHSKYQGRKVPYKPEDVYSKVKDLWPSKPLNGGS